MALINCPECGKEVSDKAEACPFCGYPITVGSKEVEQEIPSMIPNNTLTRNRKPLIIAGIILGALVLVAGIFFVIQKSQSQARINAFNLELHKKITEDYDEGSTTKVEVSGAYGSIIKFIYPEPIVDISSIAKNEKEKANMDKLLTMTYGLSCYYHFVDRGELLEEFQNKAEFANDELFMKAFDTEPICRVSDNENNYEIFTDSQGETVYKKNGEIVDVEITN